MSLSIKKRIGLLGLLTAAFSLLTFSGCAVGPDYVRPETPLNGCSWQTKLKAGLNDGRMDPQTLASWWTTLNDPVLSSLIQQAATDNLSLKEACARIREARARRGISRAELFPTLDATGSAGYNRSKDEKKEDADVNEADLYAAGFDAVWELDVFGGKRRGLEASEADLQASKEDFRDVLVSLLAEVALNYVEVRTFQMRLSISRANLDAQQETYHIAQWRFQAGLTTQLDVEQARYNLEQTHSQIPTLQTGLEQAKNRLSVLLGHPPGFTNDILADSGPIPVTPLQVAVGVPADVLRRRPDIRSAERRLAAQTAEIGVATAELYPKFSLIGSIGLETAVSIGDLFLSGNRTLVSSMTSNVLWTIFDAGQIRENIKVQTALQEQALAQYEAVILTALEEVENALIAYADEQARRKALLEATRAAQNAVDLSSHQYNSGLIDFQAVLDAQRSLLSFQDQLAVSEGEVTSNLISLYKALGGGWTSLSPDQKNSFGCGDKQ
jgi:NodT family efflux transporter outer membrane factor (OMF) lipoprotein